MSESGSGENLQQIALRRLVEKKVDELTKLLHEFHKITPPERSGPIYLYNEQRFNEIIQSNCIAENRRLMIMNGEASNVNYFNYASLHPPTIMNASLAQSCPHLFKQPAPPQHTFHPPVSSYQESVKDLRQRSRVNKKFTNIYDHVHPCLLRHNSNEKNSNDNCYLNRSIVSQADYAISKKGVVTKKFVEPNILCKRTKVMKDVVQIGLSEKENLIQPESENESSSDEDIPIKEVPVRARPKKQIKQRTNAISKNIIPTHTSPTLLESETPQLSSTSPNIISAQVTETDKEETNIKSVSSTNSIDKIKVDYIMKNWTIALVNNSLRIRGDKYDKNGSKLLKSNSTSRPVILCLKGQVLIRTDKCIYALDGKLYDPDNAIPDSIKSMCCNQLFPKFWRKLLNSWIKIESETEGIPVSGEDFKNERTKTNKKKALTQLSSKSEGTKSQPRKIKSQTQEDHEMGRRIKSKPQKKTLPAQDDPVSGEARIEPQKTQIQEDPKKESKTNPQKEKFQTQEDPKSKGVKSKVHKAKSNYSKNKVNKLRIEQDLIEMKKKTVFDEMMSNNSMCSSTTRNGLLNSITNNDTNIHTPPVKLLHAQESIESSENDSGDDFILPRGTVGRLAQVNRIDNQCQRLTKSKPKTKIQDNSTSVKESVNFSDLPSIIDEDSD